MKKVLVIQYYISKKSYKRYFVKRKSRLYPVETLFRCRNELVYVLGDYKVYQLVISDPRILSEEVIEVEVLSNGSVKAHKMVISDDDACGTSTKTPLPLQDIVSGSDDLIKAMCRTLKSFAENDRDEILRLLGQYFFVLFHPDKSLARNHKSMILGRIFERYVFYLVKRLKDDYPIEIRSNVSEIIGSLDSKSGLFKESYVTPYMRPDIVIGFGKRRILVEVKLSVHEEDLDQLKRYVSNDAFSYFFLIVYRKVPMTLRKQLEKMGWIILDSLDKDDLFIADRILNHLASHLRSLF